MRRGRDLTRQTSFDQALSSVTSHSSAAFDTLVPFSILAANGSNPRDSGHSVAADELELSAISCR